MSPFADHALGVNAGRLDAILELAFRLRQEADDLIRPATAAVGKAPARQAH
jgi:hypothetical protein